MKTPVQPKRVTIKTPHEIGAQSNVSTGTYPSPIMSPRSSFSDSSRRNSFSSTKNLIHESTSSPKFSQTTSPPARHGSKSSSAKRSSSISPIPYLNESQKAHPNYNKPDNFTKEWTPLDTRVNLPALLNDPNKWNTTTYRDSYFTKTWGQDFVHPGFVDPPHNIPYPITWRAFDSYFLWQGENYKIT